VSRDLSVTPSFTRREKRSAQAPAHHPGVANTRRAYRAGGRSLSDAAIAGREMCDDPASEGGAMEHVSRVLIVANQTAATPALLQAVRDRTRQGPCDFTLLVPALSDIPAPDYYARRTLALALPLLREAAGGNVRGMVGPSKALQAVEQTLSSDRYDEVIVSTLPETVSEWFKRDLPAQIRKLGLPVTVVKAQSH